MSIKKRYLKTRPVCKVTFRLPKAAAESARKVHIAGEFNNWDTCATPMKELKDGTFTVTIDLEANREYQFRYFIDETSWENDWDADKYLPSIYGSCENSVVIV